MTILETGHRSEFGYDGLGRRVSIRELAPDKDKKLQVTNDKTYLWDGAEIAQERSADGKTLFRQFFAQGFVDTDGSPYFYIRDQMESVREVTDGQQNVRARYDYDPYGRMTKLSGDMDAPITFTGHFWHAPTGLDLAWFRAYDPNLGRWIQRDPMNEAAGWNLYGYVFNDPTNMLDPSGLDGVYIWYPQGGNVGHAAVEVGGTYFSFWPSGAFPSDGFFQSGYWSNYPTDKNSEGRPPDVYLPLDGPNYPDPSNLLGPNTPPPGYNPWHDCADEANDRLKKNYPKLPHTFPWNGVYWPSDLLNDVRNMRAPLPPPPPTPPHIPTVGGFPLGPWS